MRFLRVFTALASLSLLTGCGYVHFGRLPKHQPGDPQLAEAYTHLSTEHKILKQELALARKEGDTLRAALDRGSAGSPDMVSRLNETTRELAALRASYAQLQTARGTPSSTVDVSTQLKLTELEEKLAASLRNYTQLQDENSRLRSEITSARTENTQLAERLTTSVAQNEENQIALAQLNTELLAQKEARTRAEQATAALRAQLSTIVASRSGPAESAAPPPTAPTLGGSSAPNLSALQLTKAPPSDTPPTAELRISPERLRAAAGAQPPAPSTPTPRAAEVPRVRIHVVEAGDTLEKIARKYYGSPERWSRIYAVNNDLLRDGRPLKAGMELEIPE